MNYRKLGNTGLMVSEVGFGGEWLERHTEAECVEVIEYARKQGINILDCWMAEPGVRTNIGKGIAGHRSEWIIQGHIGSTWQDGQYVRTRDPQKAKEAFEDLLSRLGTDYIDLGMIHYVDQEQDWNDIQGSEYLEYILQLKKDGVIKHIGMSTHNPLVARKAVRSGLVEMILFSINPAFDMRPASENIDDTLSDVYTEGLSGIDPDRAELYRLCEEKGVGITVMKGFGGGRLFDPARSPFGVTLTPVQCLHYCLTRPAVASVMCGFDDCSQVDGAVHYETASDEEKDYATVLANAPSHAFTTGQCTYCGHCRPCPMNIDIAMVNKLSDFAAMQPEVPASVRDHYEVLSAHASDCIGCQSCEERCPFGVRIAERMVKTAELFGK